MSGWLNLLNIGIDAAQSYQIRKTREDLGRIHAGQQEEAARKLILEMARNFVFEIAQQLKALEDQAQTAPQQAYIVARALDWRLQDNGISPVLFPDFADKEYIENTFSRIRAVVKVSKAALSEEQLDEAELAVKFVTQSDLLNRAIAAASAWEELQARAPEWRDLSKQAASASNGKTLGCLALIGTFTVLPAILGAITMGLANESEGLGAFAAVLSIIVWGACLVGGIVLRTKKKPEAYEQMKTRREELNKQLLSREQWEPIISLFGSKSSQGYRDIQSLRADFIGGIVDQVQGLDGFLPAGD